MGLEKTRVLVPLPLPPEGKDQPGIAPLGATRVPKVPEPILVRWRGRLAVFQGRLPGEPGFEGRCRRGIGPPAPGLEGRRPASLVPRRGRVFRPSYPSVEGLGRRGKPSGQECGHQGGPEFLAIREGQTRPRRDGNDRRKKSPRRRGGPSGTGDEDETGDGVHDFCGSYSATAFFLMSSLTLAALPTRSRR